MDNEEKSWMNLPRYTNDHINGVNEFLNMAFERGAQGNKIMCPCKKCSNRKWLYRNVVEDHLVVYGFINGYMKWIFHGEDMMAKLQNSGKPVDADILAELCACSIGEASNARENNIGTTS